MRRFYYDCLMKPNSRSVLTALRKVKDLQYNTIATGHGPVLRYNMPELVQRCVLWARADCHKARDDECEDDCCDRYKHWSEEVSKAPTNVLVLYASDYGFSDRLSQSLAAGITKAGVATEMMDLLSADPQARASCCWWQSSTVGMTRFEDPPQQR